MHVLGNLDKVSDRRYTVYFDCSTNTPFQLSAGGVI
jgi:hypothetical protein